MLSELTEVERGALRDLLARPTPVRVAIEKFVAKRKADMEASSADCLRSVPRQLESAVDYAAKAEVYGQFMKEIQRFADQ